MIVCSCNLITDTSIRTTLSGESCPQTPIGVYKSLGCRPNCGRCFATVSSIISEAMGNNASGGGSYDGACDASAGSCCMS
jgi:bacterioferritin-associated ferredoxin